MKINFTKKEFKKLIELLAIADWIITSHNYENKSNPYKELIDKLLEKAKEFGLNEMVEKSVNEYIFTDLTIDKIYKYIEEFNENEFWDNLVLRLAERDLLDLYGEENLEKMDIKEFLSLRFKYMDKYYREFEENGIKNLRIKKNE